MVVRSTNPLQRLLLSNDFSAPGSQNGFDNSGQLGPITWTQGDTIAFTIKVLNKIRDDYASHPAVSAIELLNEPAGWALDINTIRQFYMDGKYNQTRKTCI